MAAASDSTLRVVSYNIHRCVGIDGAKRPERIAQVLQKLDFDIAGLQEVESGDTAFESARQLAELARLTGSRAVAGATVFDSEGDYGNGLLVRGTPLQVTSHDLSVDGVEPRGALDVVVRSSEGVGRVIVTHLGLGIAERRFQIGELLRIVAEPGPLPTIVLGDFNEWFPWARGRRRLVRRFSPIPLPKTFPTRCPLFALDHVWTCPGDSLQSLSVVKNSLTRMASDHFPVLAEVKSFTTEWGESVALPQQPSVSEEPLRGSAPD